MTTYRYVHLDVFTDRRFEGNQLAVFPEPAGLAPETMQRIANEMAFSESTFILPAEGSGDVRMRIFTPADELPMAGHPTIGSTFALAALGRIAKGRDRFVFELGVGPTPVDLEWSAEGLSFARMTQPNPSFGNVVRDRRALAAAIAVDESDLAAGLEIQMVSCGVPYLIVPLATRRAVDAVAVDRRALKRTLAEAGLPELGVYLFTLERGAGAEMTYSRMLAPAFGIVEDPATGSASGPLGSYLLHHGAVPAEQAREILNLQGAAMGRPSRLHISIEHRDGAIARVQVGGQSVLVGEGTLQV
jgi:trans-2,3-dihydro-3-hydroxyanthranilate isomerase